MAFGGPASAFDDYYYVSRNVVFCDTVDDVAEHPECLTDPVELLEMQAEPEVGILKCECDVTINKKGPPGLRRISSASLLSMRFRLSLISPLTASALIVWLCLQTNAHMCSSSDAVPVCNQSHRQASTAEIEKSQAAFFFVCLSVCGCSTSLRDSHPHNVRVVIGVSSINKEEKDRLKPARLFTKKCEFDRRCCCEFSFVLGDSFLCFLLLLGVRLTLNGVS
jgi:hypothetical protein